jgi:uncharacterized metal-binding protein
MKFKDSAIYFKIGKHEKANNLCKVVRKGFGCYESCFSLSGSGLGFEGYIAYLFLEKLHIEMLQQGGCDKNIIEELMLIDEFHQYGKCSYTMINKYGCYSELVLARNK